MNHSPRSNKQFLPLLASLLLSVQLFSQTIDPSLSEELQKCISSADIPGGVLALISSDSIVYGTAGVNSLERREAIAIDDHFHIGSCTKSMTGLIAGRLVKEKKIQWNTTFFELFPELKSSARPTYHNITLADLLAHKARIRPFTDDSDKEFKKLPTWEAEDLYAREAFAAYALSLKPVKLKESYSYSNGGYAMAAAMLEKATGQTWEELIAMYFEQKGWELGLGYAVYSDKNQPYGHFRDDKSGTLKQLSKADDFDLWPWAAPAGDVSMKATDFASYIQSHLIGLREGDLMLSKKEYEYLHYTNEVYAMGWGHATVKDGITLSTHNGSAGAFLAEMLIVPDKDFALMIVINSSDDEINDKAVKTLRNKLVRERVFN